MTSLPDERRAKALELHLAGATYDAIAKAVGYNSKQAAYKAVQAALERLGRSAGNAEVLDTELARLDAMLTGLWGKARRGDVQAIDRVLRIGERRQQLLVALGGVEQAEREETGLSDFEKRLRERESGSKAPRRASGQ